MAATRNTTPSHIRAEAVRRVHAGETQQAVARDVGVWPETVSRWVRLAREQHTPGGMEWFLYRKVAA